MGHEAVKLELIEWLSKLEDAETIKYLKIVKESSNPQKDWWHDLTEQQQAIENGLKNISVMKTMTCKQLDGACNKEFQAETFDQIAEMSKQHGMKMFQKKDSAHLEALRKMQELMQKPDAMRVWFDNKRKVFESLPENK